MEEAMKPKIPSLIVASAAARPRAKQALVVVTLVLAVGFLASPMLMPSAGIAQDGRVTKSMTALKDQTAKLGAPKIEGKDAVGGKEAPALYFGSTKMNKNVVVDSVAKKGGEGMAATLFAKGGDEYIRVATTVPTPDKKGRAIGTVLDGGPALDTINAGKAYYGEATVLGVPYICGYEPIIDPSGAVIGAYFVGYKKPSTLI
jgi:Cache 3/Cache 2 fusion domain